MVNDSRFAYYRNYSERIVAGSGEDLAGSLGIPNVGLELLPGFASTRIARTVLAA